MIHISKVREQLRTHKPCNLSFWKKNGQIVKANNVECTSTFFKNDTANIRFQDSGEFRKIRIEHIFEFNGEEVSL